jgi:hypothetical protein
VAGSIPCSRIVVHQVGENRGFHPLTIRLQHGHRAFMFVSEEQAQPSRNWLPRTLRTRGWRAIAQGTSWTPFVDCSLQGSYTQLLYPRPQPQPSETRRNCARRNSDRTAAASARSHQEARLLRAVPGARDLRVRRLASHPARGPGAPGGLVNDAQGSRAAAALLAVRKEGGRSRGGGPAETARSAEESALRRAVGAMLHPHNASIRSSIGSRRFMRAS